MVKWVNAQGYTSPISGAIERAAQSLWGDTLTPSLKREQLLKAQRENAGAQNMMDLFREVGGAAAGYTRPGLMGGSAPARSPEAMAAESMYPIGQFADAVPPVDATGYQIGRPVVPEPENWPAIKAGIFAGESGGDPNALFGFSNRPGGTFDDVSLVDMTVDEALNFADPNGPYGQTVKGQTGRVATPMGQFQVVGSTLRQAKEGMGLTGSERMTPEVQDDIGKWIYQTQGTDAWEGYRGPQDPSKYFLPPAAPSGMSGAPATDGSYNPLNPGQFFGELAARAVEGGIKGDDAANLARMFMSGAFGAENQATTDAAVGAGGSYDKTYSGFAADQNRMERDSLRDSSTTARGQDLDFSLGVYEDDNDMVNVIRDGVAVPVRKRDLLPTDQVILSDSEVKGGVAQGMDMTPEQQAAYVGAEPKTPPQADAYVSAANPGQVYRSIDGVNDVNGAPLPADALKTSVSATSRDATGLTNPVKTGVQTNLVGLDTLGSMVAEARSVAAKDPTLFGITGAARTAGQNLMQQWQQFQQVAPQEADALTQQNQSMLDSITSIEDPDGLVARFLSSEYDPNLSTLDLYGRLLPYAAAAALAQQEGKGLSNQDVTAFRSVIGDPTSLWGTQAGFLSRLDVLDKMITARKQRAAETLEGGVDALAQPNAAPEGPAQINSDEEYDALPSGAEFIAPDGSRRRKP